MPHTLDDIKHYHNEAKQFFTAQLWMLKTAVSMITDDRIGKTSTLLLSAGHTGSALLELSDRTESFTGEQVMLARSFLEKVTNFIYASICDEKEYRAFILHPAYKHYHLAGTHTLADGFDGYTPEKITARKAKQDALKKIPIVQEALAMFSETKPNLKWTKTNMDQRIDAIAKWGKLLDPFFFLCKAEYYSDASEALHGSLYGCTFDTGALSPGFTQIMEEPDGIEKKLYKDSTCVLLHLGMLIHESFTLIKYSSDIEELWNHSYDNRRNALSLLMHVLEIKTNDIHT